MRNSPYLDRPLRSLEEASRQLGPFDHLVAQAEQAQKPTFGELLRARYDRELERIRNAGRQVRS